MNTIRFCVCSRTQEKNTFNLRIVDMQLSNPWPTVVRNRKCPVDIKTDHPFWGSSDGVGDLI